MGPGTASNHSFVLWHPLVSAGAGVIACDFDMTPSDAYMVGEGTKVFASGLARTLGFLGDVIDWRFSEFCTPYYSSNSESEVHEDRFPVAWRVRLRVRGDVIPFTYGGLGPYYFSGYDESSDLGGERVLYWNRKKCIVIGDVPVGFDGRAVASVVRGDECGLLNFSLSRGTAQQVRIDLGVVEFPDQTPMVEAQLARLERLGFDVSWISSYGGPLGDHFRSLSE